MPSLLSNVDIVMNVKNVGSWLMVWYMALNYCCSSCNFSYVFYWLWTCFGCLLLRTSSCYHGRACLSIGVHNVQLWRWFFQLCFFHSCFTGSKWDFICKCMWHEVYVLCAFCHLGSVLQIMTCNYNDKHKYNWLPVGRAV